MLLKALIICIYHSMMLPLGELACWSYFLTLLIPFLFLSLSPTSPSYYPSQSSLFDTPWSLLKIPPFLISISSQSTYSSASLNLSHLLISLLLRSISSSTYFPNSSIVTMFHRLLLDIKMIAFRTAFILCSFECGF